MQCCRSSTTPCAYYQHTVSTCIGLPNRRTWTPPSNRPEKFLPDWWSSSFPKHGKHRYSSWQRPSRIPVHWQSVTGKIYSQKLNFLEWILFRRKKKAKWRKKLKISQQQKTKEVHDPLALPLLLHKGRGVWGPNCLNSQSGICLSATCLQSFLYRKVFHFRKLLKFMV